MFFHRLAYARKLINIDTSIILLTVTDGPDMMQVFTSYFGDMFSMSQPDNIYAVTQLAGHMVSQNMLDALRKNFIVAEALDQMPLGISPGPDVMSVSFYQNHCDIVDDNVIAVILDLYAINNVRDLIILYQPNRPCVNP